MKEKKLVILMGVVTALCLIGDSLLYIYLPVYWENVGLNSLTEVGILLSINRFIRIPLNPLVSFFIHRHSLKKCLVIAILLAGLVTLGYGLASSFIIWLFLRMVWGISWTLLRMGGMKYIIQISPDHQTGQLIGLYNGIFRLGSLGGMLIGGFVAPYLGLFPVSIALFLIILFALPMIFNMFSQVNNSSYTKVHNHSPQLLHTTLVPVWWILAGGLLVSLLFQGIITSSLTFIIDVFWSEPSILLFTFAAAQWGSILQGVRWSLEPFVAKAAGKWGDRYNKISIIIYLFLITGVLLLIYVWNIPFPIWCFFFLSLVLTGAALNTLLDALLAAEVRRRNHQSYISFYTLTQDLGAAIGPLLFYLLMKNHFPFHFFILGCSVLCLIFTLAKLTFYKGAYIKANNHFQ
ncbi:MFS transporter [Cytobacillus sp. FJAT-54145]|uniref:MFS transporter n=1 Tax=Cytobacillus spartinae TaxID=3299023 RepID=A0ABW6KFT6_9BACI